MRKILLITLIIFMFAIAGCTYTNRVGLAITTTQSDNSVSLQKDNLIECCTFTDDKGNERTCAAVKSHGCDICKEKCG
ncbi:hypothetical protein D6745_01985 [Candidatus Woesearchaeota archaeon]|nr:MAG: hypothetical protein D6745_01985 [Candidatus Woesearchaeota archaeon]